MELTLPQTTSRRGSSWHGDRPALGHLHQVGQQRCKAGTACHQAGLAILEQGAARGRKVVKAPGVKDQDALLLRHSLTLFQSRKAVGRHIGLLPDELRHPGVAHRLKGSMPKGLSVTGTPLI